MTNADGLCSPFASKKPPWIAGRCVRIRELMEFKNSNDTVHYFREADTPRTSSRWSSKNNGLHTKLLDSFDWPRLLNPSRVDSAIIVPT